MYNGWNKEVSEDDRGISWRVILQLWCQDKIN